MKTIKLKNLLYSLLLIFAFQPFATAQEAPENVYVEVACVKAESDQLGSWMKENGMKFNKIAQEKGAIIDWVLIETVFPNGEECKCDYRMVTVFTGMNQMDMMMAPGFGPETAQAAFGEEALSKWETFQSMARFVGSKIYVLKSSAMPGPSYSAMSVIDYIQVDGENESEWMKLVNDVWMPVIKEVIKQGHFVDFAVWKRIMGGQDDEGNYLTVMDVNSFSALEAMNDVDFPAIFKSVHPDKNLEDVIKQGEALENQLKQEYVRLVAALNQPAKE